MTGKTFWSVVSLWLAMSLLSAEARGERELGWGKIFSQTTIPAFDKLWANDKQQDEAIQVCGAILQPHVQVSRCTAARSYYGLLRVSGVECWQSESGRENYALVKVQAKVFVWDVEKQREVLRETVSGYAVQSDKVEDFLPLLGQGALNMLRVTAGRLADKWQLPQSSEQRAQTRAFASPAEFAKIKLQRQVAWKPVTANALALLKPVLQPNNRKIFLGSKPEKIALSVEGYDAYGEVMTLAADKILWRVEKQGDKPRKLATPEWTASTPGNYNFRVSYQVGKDRTLESGTIMVQVRRITRFELLKPDVMLSPGEIFSFQLAATDDSGEAVNLSDLGDSLMWQVTPDDLGKLDGPRLTAGKKPGRGRVQASIKHIPDRTTRATVTVAAEVALKLEVIPPAQGYYVGDSVDIMVNACSGGQMVTSASFLVYADRQILAATEGFPGLYRWTPGKAGQAVILVQEKNSGVQHRLEVAVATRKPTADPTGSAKARDMMAHTRSVLGFPRRNYELKLSASLNQEEFAPEASLTINYQPGSDGYVYILNAMSDQVQMILPGVGYKNSEVNRVVAGKSYTYPYPAAEMPDAPVKEFGVDETSELYLVILSRERLDTLDKLLKVAKEKARQDRVRGVPDDRLETMVPLAAEDIQCLSEELLGQDWGHVVLYARVR
jgi:hypothetical protein